MTDLARREFLKGGVSATLALGIPLLSQAATAREPPSAAKMLRTSSTLAALTAPVSRSRYRPARGLFQKLVFALAPRMLRPMWTWSLWAVVRSTLPPWQAL